jgi:hypothetical protein
LTRADWISGAETMAAQRAWSDDSMEAGRAEDMEPAP